MPIDIFRKITFLEICNFLLRGVAGLRSSRFQSYQRQTPNQINYSLKPSLFSKLRKIYDLLLQKQVLLCFLQNSCSKHFWKSTSETYKCTYKELDHRRFTGNFQGFWSSSFCETIWDRCFQKFKRSFFQNNNRCLWMNIQEILE